MQALIVDDDEDFAALLELQLAGRGFDVEVASSGEAGWALLEERNFPVALIDWGLPDLDGLGLCRRVRRRRNRPYTHVILVTTRTGRRSYLEGMEAGADDFLEKPLDFELLEARLAVARRVLQLHEDMRALTQILPLCSSCHKIKEDDGSWQRLDLYITAHTGTAFSHGYCPQCYERALEEIEGQG